MKIMRIQTVLLFMLSLSFGLMQTEAQTAQSAQKKGGTLIITSDTLTFEYDKQYAVFQGNVVVTDPTMKITSDKMTVYFTENNEIKTIVAVGDVVITQDNKKAVSDRASYNAAQEVLILTGRPAVISSGASTSQGKKITFWIKDNRTVIEGATVKIKGADKGGVNILGGLN